MGVPLISVILPVFNVEPFIKDCMDSILNQTIQNFEVLAIDDCSTDNTVTVIESYNDNRVRIIKKKKNKGLIDSLNLGFKLAKGKYIARVDGDDINVLNRFEKQLLFLESHPDVDLCGTWANEFGGNNRVLEYKEKHNQIVAELLIKSPICHPSVMLRRESYVSFSFDKAKKHVEDYDFWARTAWSCKMHNLQEVLYYYRVHGEQVSNKYKEIQEQGDLVIQLGLFKKLNYNTGKFKDALLSKFLLKPDRIELEEFTLFFFWLKELILLNNKSKIFNTIELSYVLSIIRKRVVFKIFFTNDFIGITKNWRKKAILKLSKRDMVYVLKLKIKERTRIMFRLIKLKTS